MTHHTLDPPSTPLDDSRPDDVPDIAAIVAASRPAEPAAEEPAKDMTPAAIAQARAAGFSDEELDGLAPEAVERLVTALDRRAIQMFGNQPQTSVGENGAGGFGAARTASPTSGFELDLDETYDDHLVEQLQAMNQFYAQQLASLTSALQQTGAPVSLTGDALSAWFDAKVSDLGDGYDSVFGRGGIDRYGEASNEVRNRVELFRSFNALRQAYPGSKDEELFDRAMRSSFGWAQDAVQNKSLGNKAKARAKSTIGRPSGRMTPNLERDPETGLSVRTIDAVQAAIDARLNR
jgi:hypothetical protein